jgi:diguanylate cyclase (GGDEF)-like protein
MIAITDPHNVSTHQLAQLHRYAGIGFLSAITNALILVAFFWGQAEQPLLLGWFAAVLMVSAIRFFHARGHQRAERGILSTGQQSATMLLLTALNGLAWGMLALLLYPQAQGPYQMFLIFMLSIACAGALPWYMAVPGTYVLYLACVLSPLIAILLAGGEAAERMMALMLVIFGGTLAITARTMHHGLMESLHKYFGYQTLASIDGLTQLSNRRTFDDTLVAEWNRAARTGLPLSVIMVDVDNFKKYNDLYGHQEGDACLREVSAALGRSVRRSGDLVARYGGEEFAVVLYQMASDEAADFAEQMRATVADLGLPHAQNDKGHVTISLGGATCIPHSQDNPADLVRAADDVLYEAKQAGRDQVRWRSLIQ